MENPTLLTTSNSGRRSSSSNSPEFEFWMVRNPSCPETFLHSADELFCGGVLLPLQLLNNRDADQIPPDKDATFEPPNTSSIANPDSRPGSEAATTLTAPKRWKDMFKKNPEKEKKKKGANSGAGGGGASMAELNIYLWPFSRSRSAGNSTSKPRPSPSSGGRKVSSAPCSRSNSAGESKSRKWPSSPNRGGVHVGRNSPVWQIKRVGSGRNTQDNLVRNAVEKGAVKKDKSDARRSKKTTTGGEATVAGTGVGAKGKVLNLNVQTCIGYRHHLSCRSDEIEEEKNASVGGGNAGIEAHIAGVLPSGEGPRGTNLFNLRNFFVKKVY